MTDSERALLWRMIEERDRVIEELVERLADEVDRIRPFPAWADAGCR